MPSISTVSTTGNPYVDGVLSGVKWGVSSLTFSFPTDASFYGSSYGGGEPSNSFEAFTLAQQAAVRAILQNYSAVANVTFTEVTESATVHGDLRYAESDAPSTAWAYYPTTNVAGGDAWFNNSKNYYDNPIKGNYAFLTMLHETGHAMGLKHPHTASGSFAAMPADKDSLEYSVMSYHSYVGSPISGYTVASGSYPTTLMMYDIAGLQAMYGANYTTNAGDTVYKWDPTTGEMSINGAGQGAPLANKVFMTVWDGGGNDTYDFSSYSGGVTVDLNPGSWTVTSATQLANLGSGHTAVGNIANALLYNNNTASLIENAIGSSGADTITGNTANNKLTGGAGNDTLDGGTGTDTAVYSGLQSNYSVTQNADGSWTVADLRSGTPDGTDTIKNIEQLQFSDRTVAVGTTTPTNTAPVASNDSYSTTAGVALTIAALAGLLANDADANGDPLSAILVSGPTGGSLSLNANGSFVFTPNTGFTGTTSFTYKVNDGTADSNTATVTINVNPQPNTAPVASNDSYTATAGTALVIPAQTGVLANDSDANGDALSAVLVSGPTGGSLSLNANGSFVFTPNVGFTGTTSFTYKVNDGTADSNTATVTINVNPQPNTAPVASNDSYTATAGTALVIPAQTGVLANDSDANGDALSAVLVSGPAGGSLSLNPNGSFVFTPNTGFTGTTSFTYKVNDGTADSNTATVTITVNPAENTAPVATDDSYTTAAGTALAVAASAVNNVLANDVDANGDPLSAVLVSGPSGGSLDFHADGSFVFTPDAGFSGTTSFTYKASDGTLDSNLATVSITVSEPPNTVPRGVSDSYSTAKNAKLIVGTGTGVLANDTDADGDTLTASLVGSVKGGKVALNPDGSFTFTPNKNFSGTASFSYVASDGTDTSTPVTVSIAVGGGTTGGKTGGKSGPGTRVIKGSGSDVHDVSQDQIPAPIGVDPAKKAGLFQLDQFPSWRGHVSERDGQIEHLVANDPHQPEAMIQSPFIGEADLPDFLHAFYHEFTLAA